MIYLTRILAQMDQRDLSLKKKNPTSFPYSNVLKMQEPDNTLSDNNVYNTLKMVCIVYNPMFDKRCFQPTHRLTLRQIVYFMGQV